MLCSVNDYVLGITFIHQYVLPDSVSTQQASRMNPSRWQERGSVDRFKKGERRAAHGGEEEPAWRGGGGGREENQVAAAMGHVWSRERM